MSIIYGLTKNRIHDLCARTGINRINGLIYEEIRYKIKHLLEEFMERVVLISQYNRVKTITTEEVFKAMENSHLLLTTFDLKRCSQDMEEIQQCLHFPKKLFQDLIREVSGDFIVGARFRPSALVLIQYYIEQMIFHILGKARLVMLNSGRQTLQPKDLGIIKHITNFPTPI